MPFNKPEPTSLVIADISGYTGYLAGVELDHAMDILADLIDTIVGSLRPPFHLSKLEGDAAFVYLVGDKVDGLHLQNVVEAAYYEFRRRLRNITKSTICQCDACRQMPGLDLKFVVHHGLVAKQMMSGNEELVGRDVILIHRLLKNNVETAIGRRPYVLYTDQFVRAAGIAPEAQSLIPHSEQIDIIGEVQVWLTDLAAAWAAEENQRRVRVRPEDAVFRMTGDIAAPRAMVWEYMTAPRLRTLWSVGTDRVDEHGRSDDGKRGAGTVNHCVHGPMAIVEEILDWRPHDYATRRYRMPGAPPMLFTFVLTAKPDGGTHMETYVAMEEAADLPLYEHFRAVIEPGYIESGRRLTELLETKVKAELREECTEPPLPVSAQRFLTEPVVQSAPPG
jgi:uncharacterized protein YndB with AHSA1/START domain